MRKAAEIRETRNLLNWASAHLHGKDPTHSLHAEVAASALAWALGEANEIHGMVRHAYELVNKEVPE